ncbi:hypothetical protein DR64_8423 [Paraburkholderia xenovorans LB400]|uniref:Lipoprotein n=1 Tax=Paraburkholderia xenovorans (strain LB400) TaxID=266265 RepID=Q13F99_PARXL|nr:hypothetical protein [Paraburkholderia xenovorans]ABE37240.1 hypothetical protein Bxe_C1392 [Paraburkholderia xenovorans LB400]AIP34326.1 hypothetical protein DR64_8423 [Paraburkholderia xenovorans LB400]
MTGIHRPGIPIAAVLSAVLIGCGGGNGNNSSSSTANQSTLSADQKTFEQFALAPNASYSIDWSLPISGTPTNGVNHLYESHASIAASPSTGGKQPLNGSAPTSIANSLSLPTTFAVGRYLIKGAIVVGSGSLNNVSYRGTGIEVDTLAADGVTVVESQLRSNLSVVPLNGAVKAAPANLAQWFNSLYYNPSLLGASSSWTPGAAYLQYTATEVADTYTVADYAGSTTSNAPNPVASGTTISALMAAGGISSSVDGTTYTLTNGSVSFINGVTTYIASAVRPNLTTPTYRTYYELNGNVYAGNLIKAGTVLGGNAYPVAAPGTSTGYTLNYSQQYQIRLNAMAVASLRTAVTF